MGISLPKLKINLQPLYGAEWSDTYVEFHRAPYAEVSEIQKEFVNLQKSNNESKALEISREFLLKKFTGGKGKNEDGELVDIEPSDFEVFDLSFYEYCLGFVLRGAKQ